MEPDHLVPPDDDTVLYRTQAGQRELHSPSGRLSYAALRLLARVTGYTDLGTYRQLAKADALQFESALAELMGLGLIDEVDTPPPLSQPKPRPFEGTRPAC